MSVLWKHEMLAQEGLAILPAEKEVVGTQTAVDETAKSTQ